MSILENQKFRVGAAALNDLIKFEGGELVTCTDSVAEVRLKSGLRKCLFADVQAFEQYAPRGELCLMNLPQDAPARFGFESAPCITFAYLGSNPPPVSDGLNIARLGLSLAERVAEAYGGYSADEMRGVMENKGVFGAWEGDELLGFIGRHFDGNMGMLEVFETYRRRGIGAELEKYLIGYVLSEGRLPVCDVYADNAASLALQKKLGLTAANGYTFWTTVE